MIGVIVFAVGSLIAVALLVKWALDRWRSPGGRRY